MKSRQKLIEEYTKLIQGYLTETDSVPAATAEKIARKFYSARLSGAEVIDIHLDTVGRLSAGLARPLAQKVVEQSRFLVLGVLTNLVDLYKEGGVKNDV